MHSNYTIFYGRKKFGVNSGLFAFFWSHVSLEKFNFTMQISIASSPKRHAGTRNAHLQRQFICLVLDVLQRGLQSRISIEFASDDGSMCKQTCLKDFAANSCFSFSSKRHLKSSKSFQAFVHNPHRTSTFHKKISLLPS